MLMLQRLGTTMSMLLVWRLGLICLTSVTFAGGCKGEAHTAVDVQAIFFLLVTDDLKVFEFHPSSNNNLQPDLTWANKKLLISHFMDYLKHSYNWAVTSLPIQACPFLMFFSIYFILFIKHAILMLRLLAPETKEWFGEPISPWFVWLLWPLIFKWCEH